MLIVQTILCLPHNYQRQQHFIIKKVLYKYTPKKRDEGRVTIHQAPNLGPSSKS